MLQKWIVQYGELIYESVRVDSPWLRVVDGSFATCCFNNQNPFQATDYLIDLEHCRACVDQETNGESTLDFRGDERRHQRGERHL